jgi:putative membrane protein
MVKDHTRLNAELGSFAKSIGLTLPTKLSAEQQTAYASLSKLSGTNFDKAYIDLMVRTIPTISLHFKRRRQRPKTRS